MINLKLMIIFIKYSDNVLFCFHFQIHFYIYSSPTFKPIDVNCTMYKVLISPSRKETSYSDRRF